MIVCLALGLGGCGGGSNSSDVNSAGATPGATTKTSGPTTSQGQSSSSDQQANLTASAEAICRRLNAQLAADKPANQSLSEIVRVTPTHVALELRNVDELSKLTAPASLAGTWQRIISYRRKLAEELGELDRAAKANDLAGIQALGASKQRVHHQLAALAGQAGFTACATVG